MRIFFGYKDGQAYEMLCLVSERQKPYAIAAAASLKMELILFQRGGDSRNGFVAATPAESKMEVETKKRFLQIFVTYLVENNEPIDKGELSDRTHVAVADVNSAFEISNKIQND